MPKITPEEQAYQYQKALTQQQLDAQQQMGAPYLLEDRQVAQAALVQQIDPARVLREIRMILKGLVENEVGEIIKEGKPLMNEEGITNILLAIKGIVNQNTIMSSLEDIEINKLILNLANDLIDDLTLNWKKYQIKDETKRDIIINVCINMAYTALKRALHGGEKRFLGTTTVESITSQPRPMTQKQTGFWGRFKL